MKKLLATLFLFTATIFSTVAYANATVNLNDKSLSLLFVQVADSGTLTPIKDQPGYYQLNLKGAKPYIGYFSDRPQRISGLFPTIQFITRWDNGTNPGSFNKEPPNVVLNAVVTKMFGEQMIHIPMQLSKPVYDAKDNTLSYTVQILPGVKTKIPSKEMDNITLFIDNGYCASCVA